MGHASNELSVTFALSVGFLAVMDQSSARPSYAFARRPRWLLAHVLAAVLLVAFVNLGLWQLRRLDERRDTNALVEARAAVSPVAVGALPTDPGEARFRAVVDGGTYDPDRTVSIRTTQDGVPGGRYFSVLETASGSVVVLRGFAGSLPDGQLAAFAPPQGEVEIEGVAIPFGRLDRPARTAVDGLVEGDGDAAPVVVQAASSAPAEAAGLTAVPLPDLGEGPHLAYAVQWFLFAAVGVVGYPLLMRRQARDGD
jgi:cytochrome oxidase assembly protein ShyY1